MRLTNVSKRSNVYDQLLPNVERNLRYRILWFKVSALPNTLSFIVHESYVARLVRDFLSLSTNMKAA